MAKLTRKEIVAVLAGIFISIGAWFIATPIKDWIADTTKLTWLLPIIGVVIIVAVLYFLKN